MDFIVKWLFLFIFGALAGWILEVGYRSTNNKQLINPGFLSGPYLPIYGFGVLILYFLSSLDYSFIPGIWEIVFFGALVTVTLTIIELIAGLIFINIFKVKLWDYSELKFNFKGVVCLRFSIIWGALGMCYYYLINPWLVSAANWITGSLPLVLLIGFVYGIVFFDILNSFKVGLRIKEAVGKIRFAINYEDLKKKYRERFAGERKRAWFFNPSKFAEYSSKLKEIIVELTIYKLVVKIKPDENAKAADMIDNAIDSSIGIQTTNMTDNEIGNVIDNEANS